MALEQRLAITTHFKRAGTLYPRADEGRLVETSPLTGNSVSRVILGCSGPILVSEKPIGTFLLPRLD